MSALFKKIASGFGRAAELLDRAAFALDPPAHEPPALYLQRLSSGFATAGRFVVFVFAILMLSETGHGR